MTAYEEGRRVARLRLPHSLNPHPEHTHSHGEWSRGWFRESSELIRSIVQPAPRAPALVQPIDCMTPAQVELLCRREGLELARIGRDRFALLPSDKRPQTMLRVVADRPPEEIA
ncbi:MAG TPA: hypothetical protein VE008_07205 [Burkholderiales bacterium]|nr:hypothetical protein [Burkholderiales bacterium]